MKQKKAPTPPPSGLRARLTPLVILRWSILGAVLLLFVLACIWANRPDPDIPKLEDPDGYYTTARVVEVLGDNARPDTWTEGRRLGMQDLLIEILSGPYKGQQFRYTHTMSAYYNVDAKAGTRIIVRLDHSNPNDVKIVNVFNYDRGIILGVLALVFCGLLVLFGGKKGLMALLGLGFTLIAVWFLLIPMILRSVPPIPATILIVIVTASVSLVFLDGFTKKAFAAALGCCCGALVAGFAAWLVGTIVPLNGFNMPEAEDLVLRGFSYNFSISGLLVCGVLISALGAVVDMAMNVASAVHEISVLNPELTPSALYRSGMNIGRDGMGTMANALILAFAGAMFNTLMLFQIFQYPFVQLMNSDLMALEILQGLAGAIGIVLTVPLVALISSQIMGRKHK